jgi:hypothetical protein
MELRRSLQSEKCHSRPETFWRAYASGALLSDLVWRRRTPHLVTKTLRGTAFAPNLIRYFSKRWLGSADFSRFLTASHRYSHGPTKLMVTAMLSSGSAASAEVEMQPPAWRPIWRCRKRRRIFTSCHRCMAGWPGLPPAPP